MYTMYNTLNTNISNCTILALLKLKVCPDEIMEKIPSISIIDNDDFLNDTLTGGDTAHRCNWMFQLTRFFARAGIQ